MSQFISENATNKSINFPTFIQYSTKVFGALYAAPQACAS